jgi:hypothetical protein
VTSTIILEYYKGTASEVNVFLVADGGGGNSVPGGV